MTAEQQLERAVLEGKERDELSAIAQAMSLKTTTRTKKADIIDQILDATGVTSGPAAAQSNGDSEPSGTNGSGTNGAAKPARRSRASAAPSSRDCTGGSIPLRWRSRRKVSSQLSGRHSVARRISSTATSTSRSCRR